MKNKLLIAFLIFFSFAKAQTNVPLDSLNKDEVKIVNYLKYRKLGTMLSRDWELDKFTRRGTFRLLSYNANYIMPLRWTDRFNRQPINENINRPEAPFRSYQDVETKFQISVKTKIIQGAFWGVGDLWAGYTQVAYWQVYNELLSRPFREMNYEPELIFSVPLNFSIKNFKWRMFQIAVNHQSNGKEHALSRSWNRIIFSTAYEWENFIFSTRTAFRFKENHEEDDNPSIQDYIGRWQFSVAYHFKNGQTILATTRNNFSTKHNRNYAEINYAFPLSGYLKGVLQVSHGYGDSLIEYNHKQTNVGFGLVLLEL